MHVPSYPPADCPATQTAAFRFSAGLRVVSIVPYPDVFASVSVMHAIYRLPHLLPLKGHKIKPGYLPVMFTYRPSNAL